MEGGMLELLTVKQVAELKGCSKQYVGKPVVDGILQSAKDGGTHTIPLENLDIKLVNAIPANGKAKIIERCFRTLTTFWQMFETYCGSSVTSKPEKLKAKLKAGQIALDSKLVENTNTLIEGYYNTEPYNGKISADKGLSKNEAYRKNLPSAVRKSDESTLNLMLMRSTRAQKVFREGVCVTVRGEGSGGTVVRRPGLCSDVNFSGRI
jgi:hypothetical protein